MFRDLLDNMQTQPGFIVARSTEAADELLPLCRKLAPALLVVEEGRIPLLPLQQLRELTGRGEAKILVLSDSADNSNCEAFLRQGCAGVISLADGEKTLRKAIEAVFQGELWIPRKVLSRLAAESLNKDASKELTKRETHIYELICQGYTNQQIADQLFISRETVRWHVRSLYSKVHLPARRGAARAATGPERRESGEARPTC